LEKLAMAWGSKGESSAASAGGMSFIGNEVTITGNVAAGGDIHIDGTIEGDLECRSLTLGAAGRVKGNIAATKAIIGGTVEGTVSAGTLTVEKSARIAGDVSYENISVDNGAKLDGRLTQRGASAAELKLVGGAQA
jgi:cytoskeletal protein CcmA (bactofilin family)